jgi:hypothetical protein
VSSAPDGFVWCGKKGDLSLYLTRINQHQNDSGEDAALYIRNENRRVESKHPITGELTPGCPAFLLPFADFWKYRPEDRDLGFERIEEQKRSLSNASIALYGLDAPEYRHRIHDAILEFADDVKNMKPPAEVPREQWLADMRRQGVVFKVNGQEVG